MLKKKDNIATYQGDDDSFEDSEGKPHHNFLFHYISVKICEDKYTIDENERRVPKRTPSMEELASFYCLNKKLIEEKKNKYRLYNLRTYNKEGTDYIDYRNNGKVYNQYYKSQLDSFINQYEEQRLERLERLRKKKTKNTTTTENVIIQQPIKENNKEERMKQLKLSIINKTLRLEDVEEEKELIEYFSYHIKFQDRAIRVIAHDIFVMKYSAVKSTSLSRKNNINISSIIACGTSGIGKTELMKLIRPLFHMEEGGTNEICFIQYCFGNITNPSHLNVIHGPGSGYKDSEKPCLVDKLDSAKDFIYKTNNIVIDNRNNDESIDQEEEEEEESNSSIKDNSIIKPNVIIVFIDELCKPKEDINVLNPFNSILSSGILQRSSDDLTFKLPTDITLLFYFTANYGADAIIHMPIKNYNTAKQYIEKDMRRRSVQECDIARLGKIVPFFPLSEEEARIIIRFNIDSYFDDDDEYPFIMDSEDRDRFICYYFQGNYTKQHGIRNLSRWIEKELQSNLITQNHNIFEYTKKNTPKPLINPKPKLHFHVIDYNSYISSIDTMKDYPVITNSLAYGMNSDNLNDILEEKSNIGYFMLCHDSLHFPCINIAQPQSDDDHDNNDILSEEQQQQQHEEKEDVNIDSNELNKIMSLLNSLTKDNRVMIESNELIYNLITDKQFSDTELANKIRLIFENEQKNDIQEEYKPIEVEEEHKEITNKESIEYYNAYNDDEEKYNSNKKDKDEESSSSSSSMSDDTKKRKRKQIDGFEWYDEKHKRARYKCLKCNEVRESRSIRNHICIVT